MRFAADCAQTYRRASRRTRRLFNLAVFDRIEVCDRKPASVRYQAPFDLLFNTGKFEYDAVVAQALSYSNVGELRVRAEALARAAGWTR
jgi:hypothetical protein